MMRLFVGASACVWRLALLAPIEASKRYVTCQGECFRREPHLARVART